MYSSSVLGERLAMGQLKNSPLEKGIPGMSNSRESFALRSAKAL